MVLSVSGKNSTKTYTVTGDDVDQSQEQIDDYLFFESGAWQEFVPTKTTLTKVDLHIGNYFSGSYPLTMTIEAPLGTQIVDKTLTAADIPLDHCDWTTFDVADTAISPGHSYYIVLTYDPGCEYCWSGASENPYPHGESSEGSDWDWCFRTYGEGGSDWEIDVEDGFHWPPKPKMKIINWQEPPPDPPKIKVRVVECPLLFYGDEYENEFDPIGDGEELILPGGFIVGLGPATIIASVEINDETVCEDSANAFLLGIAIYVFP